MSFPSVRICCCPSLSDLVHSCSPDGQKGGLLSNPIPEQIWFACLGVHCTTVVRIFVCPCVQLRHWSNRRSPWLHNPVLINDYVTILYVLSVQFDFSPKFIMKTKMKSGNTTNECIVLNQLFPLFHKFLNEFYFIFFFHFIRRTEFYCEEIRPFFSF